MKNRRKAVQPFEIKKRKIDISRNYEANGFEKNQRKFENFSTLISKKSIYALLKSNDGAFRFLLITGVTDFRQTCLLNDLNHLTDLKRLSQGSLLGVSSDDLVRGFDDCLTQPSETVPTKNNNI